MKWKSIIDEYEDIAAGAPIAAGILFGLFVFVCLILFIGAKEYVLPFISNLLQ